LPLDVRWEGIDADGLWLWVASCSDDALAMLQQGIRGRGGAQ
jgi:hypothetical protein